jgi:NitT/TauT family transport system permease protein/putative hydroxymethylpyrimidine transport system permease protein
VIAAVALLALLIGAWELYADLAGVDSLILPAPHAVASSLWNDRGLLASNLGTTAGEVALGLLLASAVHLSPLLRRAIYPLLIGSQAIPVVVVAPLLVFWLGFGLGTKLVVIVLVCFFPVVVTTVDALAALDREQLKLMRTLDASRWQAFRFAEAPAALPAALSGARIALAVAVIGAFFAEYTAGSSSGLGHLVLISLPQFQTARAYAAVLLLGAFAVACFLALTTAERRLSPWTRPDR